MSWALPDELDRRRARSRDRGKAEIGHRLAAGGRRQTHCRSFAPSGRSASGVSLEQVCSSTSAEQHRCRPRSPRKSVFRSSRSSRRTKASTLPAGKVYTTLTVLKRGAGTAVDVVCRGVAAAAVFALRPDVRIVSGRTLVPGRNEIIVGASAARQYAGLDVGDSVQARSATLEVVGDFVAEGAAVVSEIWTDRAIAQGVVLAAALDRTGCRSASPRTGIARLVLTLRSAMSVPSHRAESRKRRPALRPCRVGQVDSQRQLGRERAAVVVLHRER